MRIRFVVDDELFAKEAPHAAMLASKDERIIIEPGDVRDIASRETNPDCRHSRVAILPSLQGWHRTRSIHLL